MTYFRGGQSAARERHRYGSSKLPEQKNNVRLYKIFALLGCYAAQIGSYTDVSGKSIDLLFWDVTQHRLVVIPTFRANRSICSSGM